jgi:hypothetical protein
MRWVVALALVISSRAAGAENLPSGSMGLLLGGFAGTGADANRLGFGYVEPLSFYASWHPMTTERRVGWEVRWNTIFTTNYGADAAQVADLQTMQMDLTVGARIRPGDNPRRYLTARVGPGLFRANQTIPPKMERAFVGAVAAAGFQQYFVGTLLMLDVDLRYGLIGDGPSQIVLTAGISINGP